ncbi:MAG TPA: hypothetical protein VFW07_21910 [Parafilimonas sp.]|nr:hypothetical protein [Parafilimonas sp.]
MKLLLYPLTLAALMLYSQNICAQTAARTTTAKQGDTVWVLVNHIKADKREQFEKFVSEIFWPMAKKLNAQDQKVFHQTRVLYPVKPETDGTYSYLFIMDPVIAGGDYDIEHLLQKMYGEQKGAEYMLMFNETAAGDQTWYVTVQSGY